MQDSLRAKFWKRVAAFTIDAIIIYVLTTILTVVFHTFFQRPMPAANALKLLDVIIALSIMVLSAWLYFALTESSPKQASLGKRALRIIVIDLKGNRIPFNQAALRFWMKIFSLFLLIIPFVNKTVSYESISGTLVINRKEVTSKLGLRPSGGLGPF